MAPKVSIIIPVYNAENYLQNCLSSVLRQSIQDIEVICVNDGSKDNSLIILSENAAKDNRIQVINQKNSGAGTARNRGLEEARGEYVLFLDADDELLYSCLEKVWSEAHNQKLDLLRCRALDYNNSNGLITKGTHNYLKKVPFFLYSFPLQFPTAYWIFPKISVAPWGGVCKREFLLKEQIRFNNLVCVNDRSFFWETVLKAERIAFSRTVSVLYRMNLSNSLVGNRLHHFDCHFKSYQLVSRLCSNQPKKYQRCILNGELLDLSNWLEQAITTESREVILEDTKKFIYEIDKSPWDGNIEKTKWYKRICTCY